jgi:ABC-type sugar transport system permease subunit
LFSDANLPYILLSPTLTLLALITIYPIFRALYLSLNRWVLGAGEPRFIGVANYIHLVTKEMNFWLPAIMATEVWQSTPFVILVVLAGIQALPHEPYESALIDGASRWQMFRFITIPLLRDVLIISLTIRLILAMRVFDKIYILTEGGPAGSTEVLSLLAYKLGLVHFRIGRANAASVVLVMSTVILLGLMSFVTRKRD